MVVIKWTKHPWYVLLALIAIKVSINSHTQYSQVRLITNIRQTSKVTSSQVPSIENNRIENNGEKSVAIAELNVKVNDLDSAGNAIQTMLDEAKNENNDLLDKSVYPSLVLGILTIESNFELRQAQRNTWLKNNNKLIHKFLLDKPTDKLIKENSQFHDIFFLNSSFTGNAHGFGEKLDIWFKYAHKNYPNIELIGKADDDVFLCNPQMFNRLEQISAKRLYYGFYHNEEKDKKANTIAKMNRHDEMFVILGRDLIYDILQKPYCHPETSKNCNDPKMSNIDTNFGGTSLGSWIENVSRRVKLIKANDEIVHYKNKKFYQEMREKYIESSQVQQNFCNDYLLFHKSSAQDMMKLYMYNDK